MIVTLYILPLPVPSTKKEKAEEGKSEWVCKQLQLYWSGKTSIYTIHVVGVLIHNMPEHWSVLSHSQACYSY